MKFSLAAAAATLAMFGSVSANCDKGPWISTAAGIPMDKNPGYQTWCESQWEDGKIINGIRVWSAKFQIKAVQFRFAGGNWGTRYGQLPDDVTPEEKTWDENGKIGMKLWNNKPDDGDPMDAVGKIAITEEGKDEWSAGGSKIAKEMYVDNPSGKLLAVKGAAGAWVTSLEFKFLEAPIERMEMTDMKFKEDFKKWNDKKQGLQPAALGSVYFKNSSPKGGENATYDSTVAIEETVSKDITTSNTHTAGFKIGVTVSGKVGVPLLAESELSVNTEASYSYTHMESKSFSESEKWGFTWRMGGTASQGIAPQRAAHCTATATKGTFESEYDATVVAYMANGKTFNMKQFGKFKSVGFANGVQDCKVIDLKDVPSGAKVEEAKHEKKSKRSTRLDRFVQDA